LIGQRKGQGQGQRFTKFQNEDGILAFAFTTAETHMNTCPDPKTNPLGAAGYIYILSNPSMPGLLKIGKTTRSALLRAAELSGGSGVPTPFVVEFELLVSDCDTVENEIHARVANMRIGLDREFFRIGLSEARSVVGEVTAQYLLQTESNPADETARWWEFARSAVEAMKEDIPQMYRGRAVAELHTAIIRRVARHATQSPNPFRPAAVVEEELPKIMAAFRGDRKVQTTHGTRYTYLP
jgi:hypothetical protein